MFGLVFVDMCYVIFVNMCYGFEVGMNLLFCMVNFFFSMIWQLCFLSPCGICDWLYIVFMLLMTQSSILEDGGIS